MVSIKCQLLRRTGMAARWLRRYCIASAGDCPNGYHDGTARIDDAPFVTDDRGFHSIIPDTWPETDPRWPTRCDYCGESVKSEQQQLFWLELWQTTTNKKVVTHTSPPKGMAIAPPGSIWFCDWRAQHTHGPDGRAMFIMVPRLPDGTGHASWLVDGPSREQRKPWTRTGEPPNVTVRPSIWIDSPTGFHGFVTDGVITSC